MHNAVSPVTWSRWPVLAGVATSLLEPRQPPVLVVSLPRSGSSWVGQVLAASQEAMYLREPMTQSHLATGTNHISVFQVAPDSPPKHYQEFADNAFKGIPDFNPNIVRHPNQWRLFGRTKRHVVIKEVNPLALEWIVQRYQPRIVFLVRHPVAVANSYLKLGWNNVEFERRIPAEDWDALKRILPPLKDFWVEHAAFQAYVTGKALGTLKKHPNASIVSYEDLCKDPLSQFQDIYRFAGLKWTEDISRLIEKRSLHANSQEKSTDPYSTTRDSKSQISSWRNEVTKAQISEVRKVYSVFKLPFYTESASW